MSKPIFTSSDSSADRQDSAVAGKQGSNQVIALLVGNDAYLIFFKKVVASKGEMHAVLPRLHISVSESQRAVLSLKHRT